MGCSASQSLAAGAPAGANVGVQAPLLDQGVPVHRDDEKPHLDTPEDLEASTDTRKNDEVPAMPERPANYISDAGQEAPVHHDDEKQHEEGQEHDGAVVETQQEDMPADHAPEALDSPVQQQNVWSVPRSPEAPWRGDVEEEEEAEHEALVQRAQRQVVPCCVSFLKSFWLVVVIVVAQFVVPVIAYVMLQERLPDESMSDSKCALACETCALQNSWDKLSLEYAVSYMLDSDFPFYEVEAGICTARTEEMPTGYILKDECDPSYVVRDHSSCDMATHALESQGFHVQVDFLMYGECVVLSPYSPDLGTEKGVLNLKVCFDHRRDARSFFVLAVAIVVALVICFCTARPARIEDDKASIQAVREGARRAASRAVRKGELPLIFRIAQITWVIGGLSKGLRDFRPWFVAPLYCALFFPWICQHPQRPVFWMIPYKGSPFRSSSLSWMTRLHFFMSVLPFFLFEAIKISGIEISSFEVRNQTPRLLSGHQPYLLWFGETLLFLTVLGGLIYVPWALGLAWFPRCFVSGVDHEPRINKLAQDIERAAFRRLQAVRRDPSWHEAYRYLPGPGLHPPERDPDWPKNAQPPNGMWKWAAICGCQLPAMPGDVLTALAVFVLDIATDTWAWYTFLTSGHCQFGGFLAAASWTSTLIQVRKRYWKRLITMSVESMAVGVETDELMGLLDTERGLETLVSLTVQIYAFYFSALENALSLALAIFSTLISFYSLAKYTTDNVDHCKDSEEKQGNNQGSNHSNDQASNLDLGSDDAC